MKKFGILTAIVATLLTSPARAETLKGGYPGCLTREHLGQFYDAVASNDDSGIQYLLGQDCVLTRANVKVSVLETSWAEVHVRAYQGNHAAEFWTSVANVQH